MKFPREVYAIQHTVTGRIYVGSTKDLKVRVKAHLGALKNGSHPNELMQEDYDKYGDHYELFVLESYDSYGEKSKEYEWMEKFNTGDPDVGYNHKDPYFTRRTIDIPEVTPGHPIPNGKEGEE